VCKEYLEQGFDVGAEITLWNGVPIDQVVGIVAANYWGANKEAHLAQGLKYLCKRPTHIARKPAEKFVLVTYLPASSGHPTTEGDQRVEREARFEWDYDGNVPEYEEDPWCPCGPLDKALDATLRLANLKEKQLADEAGGSKHGDNFRPVPTPEDVPNYRAGIVPDNDELFGYIRLYTFETSHPERLVGAFAGTLNELRNTAGLILDIRDNPGGNVIATAGILQALAKDPLPPIPWELISSRGTLRLVDNSVMGKNAQPILEAIETGAVYFQDLPQPQRSVSQEFKGCYKGNVVLVVNALCYSASDIFAASFQDHKLGKVMGVHERTGSGGANVIHHSILKDFFPDQKIEIEPPICDKSAWKSLLDEGGSRISEQKWATGLVVSPPRAGEEHNMPLRSIEWEVKAGAGEGEPIEYTVKFDPWITNDALLAYAMTSETIATSGERIKKLPEGVNISFSFRRTVRQGGNNLGSPLEDLGVKPDRIHRLTQNDILRHYPDLFTSAVKLLRET
jgi:hypothetical protein